jgi:hypothetical protein
MGLYQQFNKLKKVFYLFGACYFCNAQLLVLDHAVSRYVTYRCLRALKQKREMHSYSMYNNVQSVKVHS